MKELDAAAKDYVAGMSRVLGAIDTAAVVGMVEALWQVWEEGRSVYICGNGGSASTSSHIACDLQKQTKVAGRHPLRALSLTDNVPLLTAWANDAGFERVFAEQLQGLGRPGDALLCISCSGMSPSIVEAIEEARRIDMRVLALGGFTGGPMRKMADVYVHVPSSDYGVVESAHLVLDHCLTGMLRQMAEDRRAPVSEANGAKPVVIIDRDGVINRNRPDSVKSWEEFEFLPGALQGLATLARHGHKVVVVTNQANIGRGLLTPAQLEHIHGRMTDAVVEAQGAIEAIYVCTHSPEEGCACRKPAPGLLTQAADELEFELSNAYLIGDHLSDVVAAHSAGARAVLVLSGRAALPDVEGAPAADFVAGDLRSAADLVTGLHNGFLSAAGLSP
jgi:D-sedoheptulose 7-phosphate isomerase